MKTVIVLPLVTLLSLAQSGSSANSVGVSGPQDAVHHNLGLPVLIQVTGANLGSGFYFSESNVVAIATAKHVLFDNAGKLLGQEMSVTSHNPDKAEGHQTTVVNLRECLTNKLLRAHPTHDVAIVIIGTNAYLDDRLIFLSPAIHNETVPFVWPLVAGSEMMVKLDDVREGWDAYVYGFPTSIGLRHSPKFDYSRPLVRKGLLAGIYRKERTLILDSAVYFGNSGGPVIAIVQSGVSSWKVHVVGIVTEMIPFAEVWENTSFRIANVTFSNSGYSVVEPVDFILELMRNQPP